MITVYDAVDLDFKRHLDDPYGLDTKLPADFKKERHIEDDNGMAFILRAVKLLLRAVPDIRMNDVVQLLPFLFICKNNLGRFQAVKEGDTLSLGRHQLSFVMAPLVHWPEVMMTYDAAEKVLFCADAFGTFGAMDGNIFADEVNFEQEWLDDARRYYTCLLYTSPSPRD